MKNIAGFNTQNYDMTADQDVTTVDQPTKKMLQEQLRKYTNRTSMHGVASIYGRNYSIVRSFLWGVIFMSCFLAFLLVVTQQIMKFYSYHTTTKVWRQEVIPLPFPAVTICNLNLYRKSIIEQDNLTAEVIESIHPLLNLPLSLSQDEIERTRGLNWEEIYNQSAHRLEDLVQTAVFYEEQINITENFLPVMTHQGRCFTFNSKQSSRSYKSVRSGASYGLQMRLGVEQLEYYAGLGASAGVKIFVHDRAVRPISDVGSFAVAPGTNTFVAVYKETKEDLPPPYDGATCRKDKELPKLKHFNYYNVEACFEECQIEYLYQRCGCRYIFHAASSYRTCDIYEYVTCAAPAISQYYQTSDIKSCHSQCFTPCKLNYYTTRTSSSEFPSTYAMDQYRKIHGNNPRYTHSYLRDNYLEISIYFEVLSETLIETLPEYNIIQLAGDIGGQVGLFLGASLMTLVEFVEFIILVVVHFVLKKKPDESRTQPGATYTNEQSAKL